MLTAIHQTKSNVIAVALITKWCGQHLFRTLAVSDGQWRADMCIRCLPLVSHLSFAVKLFRQFSSSPFQEEVQATIMESLHSFADDMSISRLTTFRNEICLQIGRASCRERV